MNENIKSIVHQDRFGSNSMISNDEYSIVRVATFLLLLGYGGFLFAGPVYFLELFGLFRLTEVSINLWLLVSVLTIVCVTLVFIGMILLLFSPRKDEKLKAAFCLLSLLIAIVAGVFGKMLENPAALRLVQSTAKGFAFAFLTGYFQCLAINCESIQLVESVKRVNRLFILFIFGLFALIFLRPPLPVVGVLASIGFVIFMICWIQMLWRARLATLQNSLSSTVRDDHLEST